MKTVKLYRYRLEGGGIAVSPCEPQCEHDTLFRLVADEGKMLTNGHEFAMCIDTEKANEWVEVDGAAK